eukprot:12808-Heterococcus_DN1.PRE.2
MLLLCGASLIVTGDCQLLRWHIHLLLPAVAAASAAAVSHHSDLNSSQSHRSRYNEIVLAYISTRSAAYNMTTIAAKFWIAVSLRYCSSMFHPSL